MFHGGTSFGFTAGSNYFHSSAGGFQVTPTRSEILQLHSGIQIWPITLPCHIIAMTTTLRWVRLETWQKSGGQSGRWSAGEVSRFMGFWGFMGFGGFDKDMEWNPRIIACTHWLGNWTCPDFLFKWDLMHKVHASSPPAAGLAEQNRKGSLWQVLARLFWCDQGERACTLSDSFQVIRLFCCNQGEHALCLNTLWLHGRDGCFKCWIQYTPHFWST